LNHLMWSKWVRSADQEQPVKPNSPAGQTGHIQNGCRRGLSTIGHMRMIRVKLLRILMI
jgi:hypothetical protein